MTSRPCAHLICLFLLTLAVLSPLQAAETARVEDFDVVGFKRDFFGTLTVTPFAADDTVPGGAGHSRVTYTGPDEPFEADWAARGVELVAFRIHRNDHRTGPEAYFPAILGSRYARVVQVIDGRNLTVDFEFNGGSPDAPRASQKAGGYFFIDCAPALRAMVRAEDRPGTLLFEAGRTYVTRGMPRVPFVAAEQTRDMRWVSSDPRVRAAIKITAEDAAPFDVRGDTSTLPGGGFFRLDAHDHGITLDGINILGPTYTAAVVQENWDGVMFEFTRGECARTLEIRNCDTFAEKRAVAALGVALPEGANWLAPRITGIVGGGGRKGDRGDGVIDMVGYQRFNLIRSTWVARGIHSIKNNDGAGNWITIDGEELDENGRPVHLVYEAQYVKRNRFPDVMLSFHDFDGMDARRGVRVQSDHFSWPMIENQYWTGGTSTSSAEPTVIIVDGFRLYLGNNGDWRRETGKPRLLRGIVDARNAVLFDRIPRRGDTLPAERTANGAWIIWGWGVQEGDVLSVGRRYFKIASRKRKSSAGPVMGRAHPGALTGYAHYWEVTLEGKGAPTGERVDFTVAKSRTAALLNGKPRKATLLYDRDLHGHWQYNRAEVNYSFRNICFNGNLRQTAGPAKGGRDYQGLWELPVVQEWINCWAMKSDGSERGEPAREIRCEGFNKTVLQLRNRHPDSRRRDHHILVDGGHLFAQRLNETHSPVHIRNRPELIYGSASFGEPRLCNPVLLDTKGLDCSITDVAFSLAGGFTLDLSNTVVGSKAFGRPAFLRVYGNGTVVLDNVRFAVGRSGKRMVSGGVYCDLANGLQKDALRLTIRGKGGVGGFRLLGTPQHAHVTIADWTLRKMAYCKRGFEMSAGWKAFAGNLTVNGKTGDAIGD